jgi:hypothetical protein
MAKFGTLAEVHLLGRGICLWERDIGHVGYAYVRDHVGRLGNGKRKEI